MIGGLNLLSLAIKKKLKAYQLDINFDVGGEIVVLFGPSGAGKTTILNCIAGLSHPDTGEIRLNNRTLFQPKHKSVAIQKRNIGYLFQDYALFPHMTVQRNIEYGMKDRKLIDEIVDVVGIGKLLDRYPGEISGGEKQRVALVRALATQPEALLLDEPFSSLDERTKKECQDELLRLHTIWRIPIIMVTHDYTEAEKLGDRILRIDQGTLIGKA